MNKLASAALTVAITPIMLVVAPKLTIMTYNDMMTDAAIKVTAKFTN